MRPRKPSDTQEDDRLLRFRLSLSDETIGLLMAARERGIDIEAAIRERLD